MGTKHPLPPKAKRLCLSFAATGLALFAPRVAGAQDALYVELEGGANVMLSAPQTDRYGPGGYLSGRVGLRLAGPVGVHATRDRGAGTGLPSSRRAARRR